MYIYEIADILFFIKSIKHPSDKFDILNYVSFTNRSADTKIAISQESTYQPNYELILLPFT